MKTEVVKVQILPCTGESPQPAKFRTSSVFDDESFERPIHSAFAEVVDRMVVLMMTENFRKFQAAAQERCPTE